MKGALKHNKKTSLLQRNASSVGKKNQVQILINHSSWPADQREGLRLLTLAKPSRCLMGPLGTRHSGVAFGNGVEPLLPCSTAALELPLVNCGALSPGKVVERGATGTYT